MAREEARARVIEDSETLVNMRVNDDGSINSKNGYASLWPQFAASDTFTDVDSDDPGTGNEVMLIRNPSGSGKRMYISKLVFAEYNFATSEVIIELFANPTITSTGSPVPSTTTCLGSGDSPSGLIYSEPTASANGTRILAVQLSGQNALDSKTNFDGQFSLEPGTDILLRGFSDGNNRSVLSSVWWSEETI